MYLSPRFWMTGWISLRIYQSPVDCSALRTLKIIDAVPILQFLQGPSCLLQGPSFWGRQQQQLIQPCSCSRCYWCRVFLGDDNGDNLYNHVVVPVVIVVVYFYFGTTTGTTYPNSNTVFPILVCTSGSCILKIFAWVLQISVSYCCHTLSSSQNF